MNLWFSTLAAIQVLKAAGRGDVLVAGQSGSCEAIASILKGELAFTVMSFSVPTGKLAIDTAVKVINHDMVPEFVLAPTFSLDRDNAKLIAGKDLSSIPDELKSMVAERVAGASSGCK